MQTGTPRGFNLQNMSHFGFNNMMPASNFPNMQGNGAGFNPQSFMGPMQGFSTPSLDGSAMHNPGAIRRGGGGGRYNRNGPYDRRGGNRSHGGPNNPFTMGPPGGMGMSNMRGGPGMGFVAQGGGGGGGKWGDGAGGRLAMAPTEAIQGRSIKSYEDLDAQPSLGGVGSGAAAGAAAGASAELDY